MIVVIAGRSLSTVRRWRSLPTIVTALCIANVGATAAAQAGADLLTPGVTVRGNATFERRKEDDKLLFLVNFGTGDNTALRMTIQILPQYATDRRYVSASLYSRLALGGVVQVRIADAAILPIGTKLDEDRLAATVQCFAPELVKRDTAVVNYVLRCVSIYEAQRVKTTSGDLVVEIGVTVTAPNQSVADQYLAQRLLADTADKPIFIRIEK